MEEVKKEVKNTTKEKNKKLTLRTLLVLVAVIIFAIIAIITFRAEYLNMNEIGEEYVAVFEQNVKNKLYVGITVFIIAYILVYISNKFIKKGLKAFLKMKRRKCQNFRIRV